MKAYDLGMTSNEYVHLYFDPNIWIENTQPWKNSVWNISDSQTYIDNHTLEERFNAYRSMIKIGRNLPTEPQENSENYKIQYKKWFQHEPGVCPEIDGFLDHTPQDYLSLRNQCYTPYAGDYHDSILLTNEAIKLCLQDWNEICHTINQENIEKYDQNNSGGCIIPGQNISKIIECTTPQDALPKCLEGKIFVEYMKKIDDFQGIHGRYKFDNLGDSSASYAFYDLTNDKKEGYYTKVAYYDSFYDKYNDSDCSATGFCEGFELSELRLLEYKKIDWPGPNAPLNEPICGFSGNKCNGPFSGEYS